MLAQKVSGTSAGLWLLVPEMLRLGLWDILKAWTGKEDTTLEPKIALQMVVKHVNLGLQRQPCGHCKFLHGQMPI
ncbi:MAG: hypothetical protein PF481_02350 [Bacteroidales bacterium]|jgi:hypothetical protein|nr:hypothetical protein [Bacteroidales bacterium]